MLKDLTADNIYIVCGHTDMRKSIDGLAALVQQQFQLDLFASSAFLFCGRRRDRMKVLLWEDDGFLLLYKRLEESESNGKDRIHIAFCCCINVLKTGNSPGRAMNRRSGILPVNNSSGSRRDCRSTNQRQSKK